MKTAAPLNPLLEAPAACRGHPLFTLENLHRAYWACRRRKRGTANALDQFVKHRLEARWYPRDCDDLALMSEDADQLRDWSEQRVTPRYRFQVEYLSFRDQCRAFRLVREQRLAQFQL